MAKHTHALVTEDLDTLKGIGINVLILIGVTLSLIGASFLLS